ncbi:MAG: helix-turn-helix domain-containing protein [Bacteroidetes bacterium]|nr:helix-turn-helix domain-containing protein [Bacteroidota bacterium]
MEITFDNLPKAVYQLFEKLDSIERILLTQSRTLPPEPDIPIDAQETADFLGVTLSTVYILNQKHEIPSCKRGKRLYFFKKDLIEWIKVGRRKTLSEIEAGVDAYLPEQRKRKMRKETENRQSIKQLSKPKA